MPSHESISQIFGCGFAALGSMETSNLETTEPTVRSALRPETSSGAPLLSVTIGAFYEKLPQQLLTPKKPDLARLIYIASDDVVTDEELHEASILLSVLSLSCPEIFARPVEEADDVPITFPLAEPKTGPIQDQPRAKIEP